MASIVKRSPNQFHIRIRQKDFPVRCQTFKSGDEAIEVNVKHCRSERAP